MKPSTVLIITFIIGGLIVLIGAFFKIMHWQMANMLLMTGIIIEISVIIVTAVLFRKIF